MPPVRVERTGGVSNEEAPSRNDQNLFRVCIVCNAINLECPSIAKPAERYRGAVCKVAGLQSAIATLDYSSKMRRCVGMHRVSCITGNGSNVEKTSATDNAWLAKSAIMNADSKYFCGVEPR